MKKECIEELELCLHLWKTKGSCEFGKHTKCEQCASPYLLYKFITNNILHRKLTLEDWNKKLVEIKNPSLDKKR